MRTNGTGKLDRRVSGRHNAHFTGGEGRRPDSQTSKQDFPARNVQPIRLQARAFLCDPADVDKALFAGFTLGFASFAFLCIILLTLRKNTCVACSASLRSGVNELIARFPGRQLLYPFDFRVKQFTSQYSTLEMGALCGFHKNPIGFKG